MNPDNERRPSAAEMVRSALAQDISDGVLLPGDPLDEEALAARFNVSRTPVREALLQLSVLGSITIVPRSGIHVSRLSLPELLALVELLAELEASCAKLATRRLTPEQAQALSRIHEESLAHVQSGDAQGYARCNAELHEVIYQACRNAPLAAEIARIRSRTRVYRRSVFQNKLRIRRSSEDHAQILQAMLAGDAKGAADAMLAHIAGGERDVADMVSQLPHELLAVDADYPGRQSTERRRRDPTAATVAPEAATAAAVAATAAPSAPLRGRKRKSTQSAG